MFDYNVIRMKRKTLTIMVTSGVVTVKAPKKIDDERIKAFVDEKSGWVEKKLAEQEKRTIFLQDALNYSKVLLYGKMCDIIITDECKKPLYENGRVFAPIKCLDKSVLIKTIRSWYKKGALTSLGERLSDVSKKIGLEYSSFALTNAKGKWGSCDAKCNIRLNWRLVMLDSNLIDYVIVHELSHTVHHDHSKAFWDEVGKFCPNFKQEKKRLKTYAPLTLLYR